VYWRVDRLGTEGGIVEVVPDDTDREDSRSESIAPIIRVPTEQFRKEVIMMFWSPLRGRAMFFLAAECTFASNNTRLM